MGIINPHRWSFYFKRLVSAITLIAFITTSIGVDVGWAARVTPELPSVTSGVSGSPAIKELKVDTFNLPEYLGRIKDSWSPPSPDPRSPNPDIIVHIQDAHCNYGAQHTINDIIAYLNREYGLSMLNLEGGAQDYDLSVFTRIQDGKIREQVADSFVREGLINGAEYFAINNPDKATLWGIEDTALYLENLNIYRDSLKHKEEIEQYLKSINYILSNLKPKIYSKELLDFDMQYGAYKAGNVEFKDYVLFLLDRAKQKAIDIAAYPNIHLLYQSMDQEKAIDFRKANKERDILIDNLQKLLSQREMETVVLKTIEFKAGRLSQADFYAYLLKKARSVKLEVKDYPELDKYIAYISTYNKIDRSKIISEMSGLEDRIKESLYRNDTERKLSLLSKNLSLLKNIFNITLTKDDFLYYQQNVDSFNMSNYVSFINSQAPLYKITATLDQNISRLDQYRDEITKFYDYSLKRDDAFMRNIKFGVRGQGSGVREESPKPQNPDPGSRIPDPKMRVAVIVTGGFHTENLCELFKRNNISYISIVPNFKNPEGYEAPYFSLLAGEMTGLQKRIYSALQSAAAAMQIASVLNQLGLATDRQRTELTRLAIMASEQIRITGRDTAIGVNMGAGQGWVAFTVGSDGKINCNFVKTRPENVALIGGESFTATNVGGMLWALGEVAIDEQMSKAEYVDAGTDQLISELEADLIGRGIGETSPIIQYLRSLKNVNEKTKERLLRFVNGVTFDGHAGGYGIRINNALSQENKKLVLLHELIAALYSSGKLADKELVSHDLAASVENAYARGDYAALNSLLASATPHAMPVWQMSPDQRRDLAERDYAQVSQLVGPSGRRVAQAPALPAAPAAEPTIVPATTPAVGPVGVRTAGTQEKKAAEIRARLTQITNELRDLKTMSMFTDPAIDEILDKFTSYLRTLFDNGFLQGDCKLDNFLVRKGEVVTYDYDKLFEASDTTWYELKYFIFAAILQSAEVSIGTRAGPYAEEYKNRYLDKFYEKGIASSIIGSRGSQERQRILQLMGTYVKEMSESTTPESKSSTMMKVIRQDIEIFLDTALRERLVEKTLTDEERAWLGDAQGDARAQKLALLSIVGIKGIKASRARRAAKQIVNENAIDKVKLDIGFYWLLHFGIGRFARGGTSGIFDREQFEKDMEAVRSNMLSGLDFSNSVFEALKLKASEVENINARNNLLKDAQAFKNFVNTGKPISTNDTYLNNDIISAMQQSQDLTAPKALKKAILDRMEGLVNQWSPESPNDLFYNLNGQLDKLMAQGKIYRMVLATDHPAYRFRGATMQVLQGLKGKLYMINKENQWEAQGPMNIFVKCRRYAGQHVDYLFDEQSGMHVIQFQDRTKLAFEKFEDFDILVRLFSGTDRQAELFASAPKSLDELVMPTVAIEAEVGVSKDGKPIKLLLGFTRDKFDRVQEVKNRFDELMSQKRENESRMMKLEEELVEVNTELNNLATTSREFDSYGRGVSVKAYLDGVITVGLRQIPRQGGQPVLIGEEVAIRLTDLSNPVVIRNALSALNQLPGTNVEALFGAAFSKNQALKGIILPSIAQPVNLTELTQLRRAAASSVPHRAFTLKQIGLDEDTGEEARRLKAELEEKAASGDLDLIPIISDITPLEQYELDGAKKRIAGIEDVRAIKMDLGNIPAAHVKIGNTLFVILNEEKLDRTLYAEAIFHEVAEAYWLSKTDFMNRLAAATAFAPDRIAHIIAWGEQIAQFGAGSLTPIQKSEIERIAKQGPEALDALLNEYGRDFHRFILSEASKSEQGRPAAIINVDQDSIFRSYVGSRLLTLTKSWPAGVKRLRLASDRLPSSASSRLARTVTKIVQAFGVNNDTARVVDMGKAIMLAGDMTAASNEINSLTKEIMSDEERDRRDALFTKARLSEPELDMLKKLLSKETLAIEEKEQLEGLLKKAGFSGSESYILKEITKKREASDEDRAILLVLYEMYAGRGFVPAILRQIIKANAYIAGHVENVDPAVLATFIDIQNNFIAQIQPTQTALQPSEKAPESFFTEIKKSIGDIETAMKAAAGRKAMVVALEPERLRAAARSGVVAGVTAPEGLAPATGPAINLDGLYGKWITVQDTAEAKEQKTSQLQVLEGFLGEFLKYRPNMHPLVNQLIKSTRLDPQSPDALKEKYVIVSLIETIDSFLTIRTDIAPEMMKDITYLRTLLIKDAGTAVLEIRPGVVLAQADLGVLKGLRQAPTGGSLQPIMEAREAKARELADMFVATTNAATGKDMTREEKKEQLAVEFKAAGLDPGYFEEILGMADSIARDVVRDRLDGQTVKHLMDGRVMEAYTFDDPQYGTIIVKFVQNVDDEISINEKYKLARNKLGGLFVPQVVRGLRLKVGGKGSKSNEYEDRYIPFAIVQTRADVIFERKGRWGEARLTADKATRDRIDGELGKIEEDVRSLKEKMGDRGIVDRDNNIDRNYGYMDIDVFDTKAERYKKESRLVGFDADQYELKPGANPPDMWPGLPQLFKMEVSDRLAEAIARRLEIVPPEGLAPPAGPAISAAQNRIAMYGALAVGGIIAFLASASLVGMIFGSIIITASLPLWLQARMALNAAANADIAAARPEDSYRELVGRFGAVTGLFAWIHEVTHRFVAKTGISLIDEGLAYGIQSAIWPLVLIAAYPTSIIHSLLAPVPAAAPAQLATPVPLSGPDAVLNRVRDIERLSQKFEATTFLKLKPWDKKIVASALLYKDIANRAEPITVVLSSLSKYRGTRLNNQVALVNKLIENLGMIRGLMTDGLPPHEAGKITDDKTRALVESLDEKSIDLLSTAAEIELLENREGYTEAVILGLQKNLSHIRDYLITLKRVQTFGSIEGRFPELLYTHNTTISIKKYNDKEGRVVEESGLAGKFMNRRWTAIESGRLVLIDGANFGYGPRTSFGDGVFIMGLGFSDKFEGAGVNTDEKKAKRFSKAMERVNSKLKTEKTPARKAKLEADIKNLDNKMTLESRIFTDRFYWADFLRQVKYLSKKKGVTDDELRAAHAASVAFFNVHTLKEIRDLESKDPVAGRKARIERMQAGFRNPQLNIASDVSLDDVLYLLVPSFRADLVLRLAREYGFPQDRIIVVDAGAEKDFYAYNSGDFAIDKKASAEDIAKTESAKKTAFDGARNIGVEEFDDSEMAMNPEPYRLMQQRYYEAVARENLLSQVIPLARLKVMAEGTSDPKLKAWIEFAKARPTETQEVLASAEMVGRSEMSGGAYWRAEERGIYRVGGREKEDDLLRSEPWSAYGTSPYMRLRKAKDLLIERARKGRGAIDLELLLRLKSIMLDQPLTDQDRLMPYRQIDVGIAGSNKIKTSLGDVSFYLKGDYAKTFEAINKEMREAFGFGFDVVRVVEFGIPGSEKAEDFLKTLKPEERDPLRNMVNSQYKEDREAAQIAYCSEAKLKAAMDKLLQWYNDQISRPDLTADDIINIAADFQRFFVALHPFADYNGRTSRLLMNYILESNGLSTAILPNKNELNYTREQWRDLVREGVYRGTEAVQGMLAIKPILEKIDAVKDMGDLVAVEIELRDRYPTTNELALGKAWRALERKEREIETGAVVPRAPAVVTPAVRPAPVGSILANFVGYTMKRLGLADTTKEAARLMADLAKPEVAQRMRNLPTLILDDKEKEALGFFTKIPGIENAKVVRSNLGRIPSAHIRVGNTLVIILNNNTNRTLWAEAIYHETREAFWLSQTKFLEGLTTSTRFSIERIAHIISSAEQAAKFAPAGRLSPYHAGELSRMNADQVRALLREDRVLHEEILMSARELGATANLNYGQVFASRAQLWLRALETSPSAALASTATPEEIRSASSYGWAITLNAVELFLSYITLGAYDSKGLLITYMPSPSSLYLYTAGLISIPMDITSQWLKGLRAQLAQIAMPQAAGAAAELTIGKGVLLGFEKLARGILGFTGMLLGIFGIRIQFSKNFIENIFVPILEEGCMTLGLYFWGAMPYVGIRALFVALHLFQRGISGAPEALPRELTPYEKTIIPAAISISVVAILALGPAFATGITLNIASNIGIFALITHILANWYVTAAGSRLGKAVLGPAAPGVPLKEILKGMPAPGAIGPTARMPSLEQVSAVLDNNFLTNFAKGLGVAKSPEKIAITIAGSEQIGEAWSQFDQQVKDKGLKDGDYVAVALQIGPERKRHYRIMIDQVKNIRDKDLIGQLVLGSIPMTSVKALLDFTVDPYANHEEGGMDGAVSLHKLSVSKGLQNGGHASKLSENFAKMLEQSCRGMAIATVAAEINDFKRIPHFMALYFSAARPKKTEWDNAYYDLGLKQGDYLKVLRGVIGKRNATYRQEHLAILETWKIFKDTERVTDRKDYDQKIVPMARDISAKNSIEELENKVAEIRKRDRGVPSGATETVELPPPFESEAYELALAIKRAQAPVVTPTVVGPRVGQVSPIKVVGRAIWEDVGAKDFLMSKSFHELNQLYAGGGKNAEGLLVAALREFDEPVGYRIDQNSKLGEGGFAQVYAGNKAGSAGSFAIKVSKPKATAYEKLLLAREAFMLQRLKDTEGVIGFHDFGIIDTPEGPQPALIMDLGGQSLWDILLQKGGKLTGIEAERLAISLLSTAKRLKDKGIWNTDIKPENILIPKKIVNGIVTDEDDFEHATLIDFGMALDIKSIKDMEEIGGYLPLLFVGSPSCAPPEAFFNSKFTPTTDLYEIGSTIFRAVKGEYRFKGENSEQKAAAMQNFMSEKNPPEAPPITLNDAPDISPELIALVAKLMRNKVEERWQSPEEALAMLPEIRAPSVAPAVARVASVLAGARFSKGVLQLLLRPVMWAITNVFGLLGINVEASARLRIIVEDVLVPILEEGIMLLGLYQYGAMTYIGIRVLFVFLHLGQEGVSGAPATLPKELSPYEKTFIPAIISAVAILAASPALITGIGPAILIQTAVFGLVTHVAANLYVTMTGARMGKAVLDFDKFDLKMGWMQPKVTELTPEQEAGALVQRILSTKDQASDEMRREFEDAKTKLASLMKKYPQLKGDTVAHHVVSEFFSPEIALPYLLNNYKRLFASPANDFASRYQRGVIEDAITEKIGSASVPYLMDALMQEKGDDSYIWDLLSKMRSPEAIAEMIKVLGSDIPEKTKAEIIIVLATINSDKDSVGCVDSLLRTRPELRPVLYSVMKAVMMSKVNYHLPYNAGALLKAAVTDTDITELINSYDGASKGDKIKIFGMLRDIRAESNACIRFFIDHLSDQETYLPSANVLTLIARSGALKAYLEQNKGEEDRLMLAMEAEGRLENDNTRDSVLSLLANLGNDRGIAFLIKAISSRNESVVRSALSTLAGMAWAGALKGYFERHQAEEDGFVNLLKEKISGSDANVYSIFAGMGSERGCNEIASRLKDKIGLDMARGGKVVVDSEFIVLVNKLMSMGEISRKILQTDANKGLWQAVEDALTRNSLSASTDIADERDRYYSIDQLKQWLVFKAGPRRLTMRERKMNNIWRRAEYFRKRGAITDLVLDIRDYADQFPEATYEDLVAFLQSNRGPGKARLSDLDEKVQIRFKIGLMRYVRDKQRMREVKAQAMAAGIITDKTDLRAGVLLEGVDPKSDAGKFLVSVVGFVPKKAKIFFTADTFHVVIDTDSYAKLRHNMKNPGAALPADWNEVKRKYLDSGGFYSHDLGLRLGNVGLEGLLTFGRTDGADDFDALRIEETFLHEWHHKFFGTYGEDEVMQALQPDEDIVPPSVIRGVNSMPENDAERVLQEKAREEFVDRMARHYLSQLQNEMLSKIFEGKWVAADVPFWFDFYMKQYYEGGILGQIKDKGIREAIEKEIRGRVWKIVSGMELGVKNLIALKKKYIMTEDPTIGDENAQRRTNAWAATFLQTIPMDKFHRLKTFIVGMRADLDAIQAAQAAAVAEKAAAVAVEAVAAAARATPAELRQAVLRNDLNYDDKQVLYEAIANRRVTTMEELNAFIDLLKSIDGLRQLAGETRLKRGSYNSLIGDIADILGRLASEFSLSKIKEFRQKISDISNKRMGFELEVKEKKLAGARKWSQAPLRRHTNWLNVEPLKGAEIGEDSKVFINDAYQVADEAGNMGAATSNYMTRSSVVGQDLMWHGVAYNVTPMTKEENLKAYRLYITTDIKHHIDMVKFIRGAVHDYGKGEFKYIAVDGEGIFDRSPSENTFTPIVMYFETKEEAEAFNAFLNGLEGWAKLESDIKGDLEGRGITGDKLRLRESEQWKPGSIISHGSGTVRSRVAATMAKRALEETQVLAPAGRAAAARGVLPEGVRTTPLTMPAAPTVAPLDVSGVFSLAVDALTETSGKAAIREKTSSTQTGYKNNVENIKSFLAGIIAKWQALNPAYPVDLLHVEFDRGMEKPFIIRVDYDAPTLVINMESLAISDPASIIEQGLDAARLWAEQRGINKVGQGWLYFHGTNLDSVFATINSDGFLDPTKSKEAGDGFGAYFYVDEIWSLPETVAKGYGPNGITLRFEKNLGDDEGKWKLKDDNGRPIRFDSAASKKDARGKFGLVTDQKVPLASLTDECKRQIVLAVLDRVVADDQDVGIKLGLTQAAFRSGDVEKKVPKALGFKDWAEMIRQLNIPSEEIARRISALAQDSPIRFMIQAAPATPAAPTIIAPAAAPTTEEGGVLIYSLEYGEPVERQPWEKKNEANVNEYGVGNKSALYTRGLTSCTAIFLFDPTKNIGAMVHVQPYPIQHRTSKLSSAELAKKDLESVLRAMEQAGADRNNIISATLRSSVSPREEVPSDWSQVLVDALGVLGVNNTDMEPHDGRIEDISFDLSPGQNGKITLKSSVNNKVYFEKNIMEIVGTAKPSIITAAVEAPTIIAPAVVPAAQVAGMDAIGNGWVGRPADNRPKVTDLGRVSLDKEALDILGNKGDIRQIEDQDILVIVVLDDAERLKGDEKKGEMSKNAYQYNEKGMRGIGNAAARLISRTKSRIEYVKTINDAVKLTKERKVTDTFIFVETAVREKERKDGKTDYDGLKEQGFLIWNLNIPQGSLCKTTPLGFLLFGHGLRELIQREVEKDLEYDPRPLAEILLRNAGEDVNADNVDRIIETIIKPMADALKASGFAAIKEFSGKYTLNLPRMEPVDPKATEAYFNSLKQVYTSL